MASNPSASLFEHKQRLMTALGPHQATYLQNLKLWFRQKWTRDEFDRESRKLLGTAAIALHNRFFAALLNKVDPMNQQQQQQPQPSPARPMIAPAAPPPSSSASSVTTSAPTTTSSARRPTSAAVVSTASAPTSCGSASAPSSSASSSSASAAKRRKRSRTAGSERAHFDAADLFEFIADECPDLLRTAGGPPGGPGGAASPPRSLSPQRFAAQELFLPDAGLIMGRLLIGAWESGLASADDAVADMIVLAVQNLLKNILTAVLLRRKHCRVTGTDGNFVYDIGQPLADPSLRSTLLRRAAPVDDAPLDIDRTIASPSRIGRTDKRDDVLFVSACEQLDERRARRRINLLDLYGTLSGDRQLVPAHSVLAPNVERMAQLLH